MTMPSLPPLILLFGAFSFPAAARGGGSEPRPCFQDGAEKQRLLKTAEDKQYNIKNIEISGNTSTRYRTFRKHWEKNFNEGDIFTIEALMKSIRGINRIRSIKPIGLEDIEVRLEENDRRGWNSINFVICVEQT